LFVSARHPLARKKVLSVAEVAMEPLIVHRGIRRGVGEITLNILKYIEDHEHKPNVLMECSSGEAVKASVMGGAGIGILMLGHLRVEIRTREVKILTVRGLGDSKINSFIISRKHNPISDNAQDFLELLKRTSSDDGRETPERLTGSS